MSSTWYVVAAVFLILNSFQWGMSKVEEGYLLDIIKESRFKATLLSLKSLIGEAATAIAGFSMGILVQVFGFQVGFGVLGISLVLILSAISLYTHKSK